MEALTIPETAETLSTETASTRKRAPRVTGPRFVKTEIKEVTAKEVTVYFEDGTKQNHLVWKDLDGEIRSVNNGQKDYAPSTPNGTMQAKNAVFPRQKSTVQRVRVDSEEVKALETYNAIKLYSGQKAADKYKADMASKGVVIQTA